MADTTSKSKKIWGIIGNVFCWVFIAFAVVVTVMAFAAQSSPDGIPTIGGRAILTVQTNSMEPTFNEGDIIIGRKLTDEEIRTLQVNDIITFDAGDLDGDGMRDLNSHRIVEVLTDEAGVVSYVTKGDHNPDGMEEHVTADSVKCQYTGTRIKGLGKVLSYLQQPTGFLIVIVLPLVVFFIFELITFIRKVFEVKNADKKQITAEDEALIRQKAVEEYIRAQQQAQQAATAPEATNEEKAE